ncbi:unnamed protein product [Ilex paraguariensis]|uniref:Mechanosensitive ion channel MscS domain-containing protein n=1 Tax=Ilex paraguariensis TaxID=185542 RepID=A0ABC8QP08_9AQUA
MAAIRFSSLKSCCSRMKFGGYMNRIDPRHSFSYLNQTYHTEESGFSQNDMNNDCRMMGLKSFVGRSSLRTNPVGIISSAIPNLRVQRNDFIFWRSSIASYRSYSSAVGGKGDNSTSPKVSATSDASGSDVSDNDFGGAWVEKFEVVRQSVIDAVNYTGERAKEASTEVTHYVHQLLNTHPYLRDVVVPVGGTLTGTILAWVVLPKILRRLHRYSMQGPATLLSGSSLWGPVPYEKSFWGALEDPLRYLITFMAFSQICVMVAPTTIASQYIAPAWRGAVILSFVWFLHRWKTNMITRALDMKSMEPIDRDKLLTLDKISSVGLFVLGLMALSEACGVAVQSILTVGGIGGVATAFAARDVLGNVFSGLSVQFSRPFSIGDTIKAGSVEGQVVEMGLTTTSLLSAEKFPVIVPNSLFSSQAIVNKSRAPWRAMVTKIPLQIDYFDKIRQISEDIKSMLRSNPNIFLDKEAPYCFLSRIERTYAELTIGCNLKQLRKDELLSVEQEILLQAVRIIKQHGGSLGSTLEM